MNALKIVDTLLEADESPSELIHQAFGENVYERWVFTDLEKSNPKNCKGTDIFLAFPRNQRLMRQPDTEQKAVRVLRNGTVLNQWEDGSSPVPWHVRRRADFEEVYVSLDRTVQAWNWIDVVTDKSGAFIRFALPQDLPPAPYP